MPEQTSWAACEAPLPACTGDQIWSRQEECLWPLNKLEGNTKRATFFSLLILRNVIILMPESRFNLKAENKHLHLRNNGNSSVRQSVMKNKPLFKILFFYLCLHWKDISTALKKALRVKAYFRLRRTESSRSHHHLGHTGIHLSSCFLWL